MWRSSESAIDLARFSTIAWARCASRFALSVSPLRRASSAAEDSARQASGEYSMRVAISKAARRAVFGRFAPLELEQGAPAQRESAGLDLLAPPQERILPLLALASYYTF